MFPTDDESDSWDGPSTAEIERVVTRALRRYGLETGDSEDDPTSETSSDPPVDPLELMTSTMRRCGLLPSPVPLGETHHLASAGPKLRDLRLRSGWTVKEIAERTGMSADLLAAFETGDSAAAGELTTFDLERVASACCGTLADLLGKNHSWVKAVHRRENRTGPPSIDPHG